MENNLHLEIFPGRQKNLFNLLKTLHWISEFYLAGGTALALQLGHRRSVDFDFFTPLEFNVQEIKNRLSRIGDFKLYSESELTLHGELNSVEVSFFNSPYPLVGKKINDHNIILASKADIAAMKLAAVSMRGKRKDFIDIYYLLKEFSLGEMYDIYKRKYGENEENIYCSLKGLIYFDEANEQKMPYLFKNVRWRDIKKLILLKHGGYIKSLRR